MTKACKIGIVLVSAIGMLAGCEADKNLKACRQENEKLTADLQAKDAELKQKDKDQIANLQKLLEYAKDQESQADSATAGVEHLKKQLAEEQEKSKQLQQQVEQSREALQKTADLMKKMDQAKAENEQSREAMKKMVEMMKKMEEENKALKAENEKLKKAAPAK